MKKSRTTVLTWIVALGIATIFLFATARLSIVIRSLGYNPSNIIAFTILSSFALVGYLFVYNKSKKAPEADTKKARSAMAVAKVTAVAVILLLILLVLFWVWAVLLNPSPRF